MKSNKLKIKLVNLDGDGLVFISTTDGNRALNEDKTIAGSDWEGEAGFAYAMSIDHSGLLAELEKDYDVDTCEYDTGKTFI